MLNLRIIGYHRLSDMFCCLFVGDIFKWGRGDTIKKKQIILTIGIQVYYSHPHFTLNLFLQAEFDFDFNKVYCQFNGAKTP